MEAKDGRRDGSRNRRSLHLQPIRLILLVVAWIALVALLIGMGELVERSGTVQGFDNHVTSIVVSHRSSALNAAMKVVTWLGSWVAVLGAAAVVLLLVLRSWLSVGFLLLVVVAWAGTQGGTTLAKRWVQRPRPPEHLRLISAHGWSWPSGHTTTATLVFAVIAAVVWVLTPRVRLRLLATVGTIIIVVAVAFSRVELGVHWTTDVLASLVFAATWLSVLGTLCGVAVKAGQRARE